MMTPPNVSLTAPRSVPATQFKSDSQDNTTPESASCATYQASQQFESSGAGAGTGASKKEMPAAPPKKEAKPKKPKKDKKDKK